MFREGLSHFLNHQRIKTFIKPGIFWHMKIDSKENSQLLRLEVEVIDEGYSKQPTRLRSG